MEKMIASFEEEHPNINIEPQHIPDAEYDTKMNTMMAGEELPDIAYLNEGLALPWAEEGHILDMTPYMKEFPELGERLPQTYYYFDEGKTIGTNTAGEVINIYYNKDLLEEEKVELPPTKGSEAWTWDEFVETAQKLTKDSKGRNALDPEFDEKNIVQYGADVPRSWLYWYGFLKSNGADIVNEDGTEYVMNSPEAIEVFQNLQDLMHKYHVAPTPTESANMPATSVKLQTKKVAMVVGGQWNILDFSEGDLNFGIGVLPKFKEPKTIILGAPTVIFSHTKHPKEAIEFYLYHNNPEKVDLFSRGLWMPLDEKYYTEAEYTDKWIDKDVHPAEYKEAVIDFTHDSAVPGPAYRIRNWQEISAAISAGLDPLWLGKEPAEAVLNELKKTVEPLLEGKYPEK
ncbi:ABC transporter substrate-binding protein [Bacillus infantis]|uniref:ABC transporter substrate-binding protein n=1 Tax=Bacillus infantis TaxID=324767 RepID=UPI0020A181D7|nr:sugar ABC transporter substrate-binding protein [Bacillus infantis]MCP1160660.1 sugar ABC transporter substrate-binding protein [Bacillus infantis]